MNILMPLKEDLFGIRQPAQKLITPLRLLDMVKKMVSNTGSSETVGEHTGLTQEMLKFKEELTV